MIPYLVWYLSRCNGLGKLLGGEKGKVSYVVPEVYFEPDLILFLSSFWHWLLSACSKLGKSCMIMYHYIKAKYSPRSFFKMSPVLALLCSVDGQDEGRELDFTTLLRKRWVVTVANSPFRTMGWNTCGTNELCQVLWQHSHIHFSQKGKMGVRCLKVTSWDKCLLFPI